MAKQYWRNIYVRNGKTTEIVAFRGGWFAPVTVDKLKASTFYAKVVQGGRSFAGPSALTHAGIGAGDLSVRGLSKTQVWDFCEELWSMDIVPCPRGFVRDSFQGASVSNINDGNEHIHFLDYDSYDYMHPQAQAQVREVLAGGDGLLGNAHYTGPSRSYRKSWSKSPLNPVNIRKKELELPTTAEVVKALSNDDNFLNKVAEAVLNLDAVPNEWDDKVADPKVKGSKANPTITMKTSMRRHDKATIANGKKLDDVSEAVADLAKQFRDALAASKADKPAS